LNSKEAFDESTATSSSVTLSGIRREKDAPAGLDIEDYRLDPGNSEPPSQVCDWLEVRYQRSAVSLPISQIRRMNSAEVRLTVCSFIPPHVDHIPDPP
jgi:hypothetical protein